MQRLCLCVRSVRHRLVLFAAVLHLSEPNMCSLCDKWGVQALHQQVVHQSPILQDPYLLFPLTDQSPEILAAVVLTFSSKTGSLHCDEKGSMVT